MQKALDFVECFFACRLEDDKNADRWRILSAMTLSNSCDSRLEAVALLRSARLGDLPMSTRKRAAAVKS